MSKDGTCPCMDPNALPRRIRVGASDIGIVGLSEILSAVRELNLTEEKQVRKELLERVKRRNWVPDEAQEKYADALILEYRKSLGEKK